MQYSVQKSVISVVCVFICTKTRHFHSKKYGSAAGRVSMVFLICPLPFKYLAMPAMVSSLIHYQ
jgi:hypothetical protein